MTSTATTPAMMKLLRRFVLRAAAVYLLSGGGDESAGVTCVASGTERDAFSSAIFIFLGNIP